MTTNLTASRHESGQAVKSGIRAIIARRSKPLFAGALVGIMMIEAYIAVLVLAANWPDILFGLDFVSFWTGASLLQDGMAHSLFDMNTQRTFQQELRGLFPMTEELRLAAWHNPFHSPPVLAVLFMPLTALFPFPTAYAVWFAFSFTTTLAAVAIPIIRSRMPGGWVVTIGLAGFAGVTVSVLEGQVNSILALLFSLSLLALVAGRPFLGGVLLGALWLKPQYAILFPLALIFKRQWRALAGMAFTGVMLGFASLAMVGADGVLRYVEMLSRIGGFRPPTASVISAEAMVNWRGLLLNVWPNVSEVIGLILTYTLGGLTAAGTLLVVGRRWDPGSPLFAREMLVIVLGTLIAVPHSHFHGVVLALPAIALALTKDDKTLPLNRLWKLTLVLGWALGLLVFPLRTLSWLFVPCGLTVIAVLALQVRKSGPVRTPTH